MGQSRPLPLPPTALTDTDTDCFHLLPCTATVARMGAADSTSLSPRGRHSRQGQSSRRGRPVDASPAHCLSYCLLRPDTALSHSQPAPVRWQVQCLPSAEQLRVHSLTRSSSPQLYHCPLSACTTPPRCLVQSSPAQYRAWPLQPAAEYCQSSTPHAVMECEERGRHCLCAARQLQLTTICLTAGRL